MVTATFICMILFAAFGMWLTNQVVGEHHLGTGRNITLALLGLVGSAGGMLYAILSQLANL